MHLIGSFMLKAISKYDGGKIISAAAITGFTNGQIRLIRFYSTLDTELRFCYMHNKQPRTKAVRLEI